MRNDISSRIRRVWTDPRLLGLNLLAVLAAPTLLLAKLRKFRSGQSPWEFDRRRWDVEPVTPTLAQEIASSSRVHVVFVGVGHGELQLIQPVAKALQAERPDLAISFCLRNPIVASLAAKADAKRNVSLWPFDFLVPITKWLATQRPDIVVFTERFGFTTLACGSARFGARAALINGRCRKRESLFYRLAAPFYRWQFSPFDAMAMQREDYARNATRFAKSGTKIAMTGDIKADLQPRALTPEATEEIERWLALPKPEPFIVAGSTETVEDENMVLEAFEIVRRQRPCRLILAPRQPERRYEVLGLATGHGYQASLRSQPVPDADVYILDTLGELSHVYRYGQVAYVGGAVGSGNGHNILEPMAWGLPVAYGMNRGHFEAIQRMAEEKNIGTRVADAPALATHWTTYLEDPARRAEVAERCSKVLASGRGAVVKTVEALLPLIDAVAPPRT